jgi:hypothetical protein
MWMMKIRWFGYFAACSYLVLASVSAWATTAEFSVSDATGAPFPNGLVILKSLDDNHEVFRALTNDEGSVPKVDLQPGLYRVVVSFPYGHWKTEVREFFVAQVPAKVTLTVVPTGTQDNVTITGAPIQTIQVLDHSGKPVSGTLVIARDSAATYEKWYRTDQLGEARVELSSNLRTLVIVSPPNLVERVVNAEGTGGKTLPKLIIRLP